MFSRGQLIFSIFFIIAFVGAMIYSYSKDKKYNPKYFKGSRLILLGFLLFILLLLAIKLALKD